MKKKLTLIISFICVIVILYGCGMMNKIKNADDQNSDIKETLLSEIPLIDKDTYNRFVFKGHVTAADSKENSKRIFIDGAVETYKNISHIFRFKITIPDSIVINAESWADFSKSVRYNNIKEEGFQMDAVSDDLALDRLISTINERPDSVDIIVNNDMCTASWNFDTDVSSLFNRIISDISNNTNVSGNGRIMAVFDPSTYEFRYFNIVVSANNEERIGALLDMTFQWDVINSDSEALIIPVDVSNNAYATSTGVTTNGGYDPDINKMAEDFIELYAGYADVSHHNKGSCMFWTFESDGLSATVNYEKTSDVLSRYETNYEFLEKYYGNPIEITNNGAYFFDNDSGELVYTAKKNDFYTEIIITGSGKSQGDLRKLLITYKSRLDI